MIVVNKYGVTRNIAESQYGEYQRKGYELIKEPVEQPKVAPAVTTSEPVVTNKKRR